MLVIIPLLKAFDIFYWLLHILHFDLAVNKNKFL